MVQRLWEYLYNIKNKEKETVTNWEPGIIYEDYLRQYILGHKVNSKVNDLP